MELIKFIIFQELIYWKMYC